MTDRQRVEALFFLLLFKSIVTSSKVETKEQQEGNAQCVALLDEGLWDILKRAGRDQHQRTLYRRAERLHNHILNPSRKGGISLHKAGMIAYYLLQPVLAAGYLELEEGSKTAIAISAVVDALGDAFAEEKLDASARKQARQMLGNLQGEGYFAGVAFDATPLEKAA